MSLRFSQYRRRVPHGVAMTNILTSLETLAAWTLFVLISHSATAQQNDIHETIATPIQIELLGSSSMSSATVGSFRGRSLVLEFWATWCPGCVTQIAHLNALAKQFEQQPVQFIAITDERKEVVERFIKRTPMSGLVGIDQSGISFKNYRVVGRPRTILIDSRGYVKGDLAPTEVTNNTITALISGVLEVGDPATILEVIHDFAGR
jgi:thiol-disulfide isomerase/thioredoxin